MRAIENVRTCKQNLPSSGVSRGSNEVSVLDSSVSSLWSERKNVAIDHRESA